jgi:hypothetical protein
MGPNETSWVERAISALDGTTLTGEEKIDAVLLLSAHIRIAHSMSATGSFPWDSSRQLSGQMTGILRDHAERFPSILAAVDEAAGTPIDAVTDGIGLECVLRGIEQIIADGRR